MSEYTITVRFFRDHKNDDAAEENFPTLPLERARRAQLRDELQEARRAGIIFGRFTVLEEP